MVQSYGAYVCRTVRAVSRFDVGREHGNVPGAVEVWIWWIGPGLAGNMRRRTLTV